MNGVRKVTEDLYWVGVNDKRIELFENIHPISFCHFHRTDNGLCI